MKQHMQKYANRSIGGEFHSSNNRNFNNYEILYRVEHSLLDMKWHKVSVSPQKKFNYLRYYSAKGGYNNIAEIKFITR